MLDPKEPVPWHYGIYTSMTPGKTGGYEVEVGFHSPADACPGVFRERYKIGEVSLLDCDLPRMPRRAGLFLLRYVQKRPAYFLV